MIGMRKKMKSRRYVRVKGAERRTIRHLKGFLCRHDVLSDRFFIPLDEAY